MDDRIEIKPGNGFNIAIRKGREVRNISISGRNKEIWHLAKQMLVDASDVEYGECLGLTLVSNNRNFKKFLALFNDKG